MPTVKLPLAPITSEDKDAVQGTGTQMISGEGPLMKNMVVTKRQDGYYVSVRNGIHVYDTVLSDIGQGIYYSLTLSNELLVKDGNLFKRGAGTTYATMTSVGAISADTNYSPVYMKDWDNTECLLKASDKLYEYDGTTLTQITDAQYPSYTGQGLVILDSYVFVLDIGAQAGNGEPAIYNSNLADHTAWEATDYIGTSDPSDDGYGIALHHDHIVYFGRKGIEFFYNAGNATGSPLARRKDIKYNIGIDEDGNSQNKLFVEHGDIIYFIGKPSGGHKWSLYKMEGFRIQELPEVNINHLVGPDQINGSRIYLSMLRTNGKDFLCIAISDRGTYLYDVELGVTSQITHGDASFTECNIAFTTHGPTEQYFQGLDATFGDMETSNHYQVYTDENSSGTTIDTDWEIITPIFTGESAENKFQDSLEVIGDYLASQTVTVSWSDDNYASFSTGRTLNIDQRRKLTRGGKFNRRAFKLSGSDRARLSFSKIQLRYREGTV